MFILNNFWTDYPILKIQKDLRSPEQMQSIDIYIDAWIQKKVWGQKCQRLGYLTKVNI